MITPESMQQTELDELLALTERQDRELEGRRLDYLELAGEHDSLKERHEQLLRKHRIVCKTLRKLLKEGGQ